MDIHETIIFIHIYMSMHRHMRVMVAIRIHMLVSQIQATGNEQSEGLQYGVVFSNTERDYREIFGGF